MARKIIYEARLNTGHFRRGVQNIDRGTKRMLASSARLRLAFRHLERGNTRRALRNIGMAASDVAGRFANAGAAAYNFGNRALGVLGRMASVLRRVATFGGVLGAVAVGVGAKSVLSAANFTSEVQRAAILSDASPGQARALRAGAERVGIETPFTLGDIASTQKQFAKFGFAADEILKLVDATKLLAVVAETDMATAGDTLVQVLGQFQLGADDAQAVALKLAGAVVNTALSGTELFDAMKDAGSAAGVFGADLTEVLAVVGDLRKQLGRAEKASVAVRNLFLVFSAIQSKSPKVLESLGLSPEEAQEAFSFLGEGGQGKSLVGVAQRLGQLLEGREELGAKLGIEKRTVLAFQTINQKGAETYTNLVNRINDTRNTQEKYNLLIDLMDQKIKRVSASFNALFVAVGDKLSKAVGAEGGLGVMVGLLSDAKTFVDQLSSSDVHEIFATIPNAIIDGISAAVAFMVEAFVEVGPIIGAIIGGAILEGVGEGIGNISSDLAVKTHPLYMFAAPFTQKDEKPDLAADAVKALMGEGGPVQNALDRAKSNPLVKRLEELKAAQDARPTVVQSGVVNNYGAKSAASRAQPSRPAGRTQQEGAQR